MKGDDAMGSHGESLSEWVDAWKYSGNAGGSGDERVTMSEIADAMGVRVHNARKRVALMIDEGVVEYAGLVMRENRVGIRQPKPSYRLVDRGSNE